MTLSSEIYSFIVNSNSNTTFINYLLDLLKLISNLIIKPIFTFLSFNVTTDLIFRINTLPAEIINFFNQPYIGIERINFLQLHLNNIIHYHPLSSGCYNGIFLCLPFTISHIYSLKELSISNKKVGVICLTSTIIGIVGYNLLHNSTILDTLIFSFLRSQSIFYIFSIILLLVLIYENIDLETTKNTKFDSISFDENINIKKHIFVPILLCMTEQIVLFPYINSIGDPLNNAFNFDSIDKKLLYVFGLVLGCFIGIFCIINITKLLLNFIWKIKPINTRIWRERLNIIFNTIMIGLVFSTFPYYTLDYLTINNIGLHSEERIIEKFLQNETVKRKNDILQIGANPDLIDLESYNIPSNKNYSILENFNYRAEKDTMFLSNRSPGLVNRLAKNKMKEFLEKMGIKISTKEKIKEKSLTKPNFELNENQPIINPNISPNRNIRWKSYSKLKTSSPLETIITKKAFNDFSIMKPTDQVVEEIKTRYYNNPIYKIILNGDIGLFLLNQKSADFSSNVDYFDIRKKEHALKNYINSLRSYQNLPYSSEFYSFFSGAKSFSNHVYTHQSKGTLRTIRRLFKVELNEPNKVLSYDQPLYSKESEKQLKGKIYHEEIFKNNSNELKLKKWNPIPFYVGWDNKSHKYVITNRFVTTTKEKDKNKEIFEVVTFPKTNKKNQKTIQNINNILSISANDFRFKESEKNLQTNLNYETIPTTVVLSQNPQIFSPPDRGIFVWTTDT